MQRGVATLTHANWLITSSTCKIVIAKDQPVVVPGESNTHTHNKGGKEYVQAAMKEARHADAYVSEWNHIWWCTIYRPEVVRNIHKNMGSSLGATAYHQWCNLRSKSDRSLCNCTQPMPYNRNLVNRWRVDDPRTTSSRPRLPSCVLLEVESGGGGTSGGRGGKERKRQLSIWQAKHCKWCASITIYYPRQDKTPFFFQIRN